MSYCQSKEPYHVDNAWNSSPCPYQLDMVMNLYSSTLSSLTLEYLMPTCPDPEDYSSAVRYNVTFCQTAVTVSSPNWVEEHLTRGALGYVDAYKCCDLLCIHLYIYIYIYIRAIIFCFFFPQTCFVRAQSAQHLRAAVLSVHSTGTSEPWTTLILHTTSPCMCTPYTLAELIDRLP